MAKRALIEHRPWLLASVTLSLAYYLLSDNPLGRLYPLEGVWMILLKGCGVGLLAAYAFRRTKGADGMFLVVALALSALADMALEIDFIIGGAFFAASHVVAIGLYLRNRRKDTVRSQRLAAFAIVIGTPFVTWLLCENIQVTIYSVTLGLMAGMAWLSRFPRYRVGIGALLFIISDWLIFSDINAVEPGFWPALLVWPLYYIGQLMIATGVVQVLRGEVPAR